MGYVCPQPGYSRDITGYKYISLTYVSTYSQDIIVYMYTVPWLDIARILITSCTYTSSKMDISRILQAT
jgi:hypothetical protein